jgi:hypothetical protein
MNKEKIEQNLVLKLALNFSLLIIEFCELLKSNKKFVVPRPLLNSGTSIGAGAIRKLAIRTSAYL